MTDTIDSATKEPGIANIERAQGVFPGRSSGSAFGSIVTVIASDIDRSDDVGKQIRSALAKVDRVLRELGSRRENILYATMYLTTNDHRRVLDPIWNEWVGAEASQWPSRCGVIVTLSQGLLFEITVVAVRLEA